MTWVRDWLESFTVRRSLSLVLVALAALLACGDVDAGQRGIGSGVWSTGSCSTPTAGTYTRVAPGECVKATSGQWTGWATLSTPSSCTLVDVSDRINTSSRFLWVFVVHTHKSGTAVGAQDTSVDFFTDAGCSTTVPTWFYGPNLLRSWSGTTSAGVDVGSVSGSVLLYTAGATSYYARFTTNRVTGGTTTIDLYDPFAYRD